MLNKIRSWIIHKLGGCEWNDASGRPPAKEETFFPITVRAHGTLPGSLENYTQEFAKEYLIELMKDELINGDCISIKMTSGEDGVKINGCMACLPAGRWFKFQEAGQ